MKLKAQHASIMMMTKSVHGTSAVNNVCV